jgi:hypothetical protein
MNCHKILPNNARTVGLEPLHSETMSCENEAVAVSVTNISGDKVQQ